MHPDAVAALACPHEHGPLHLDGRTLACDAGHRFDLARQGYANLRVGRDPGTGDGAAMVAARQDALDAGVLAPLTATLAGLAADHLAACSAPRIVDVGAGTGHHLAAALDAVPVAVGVATDLSPRAARRAARAHARLAAVVADTWRGLPVADHAADLLLCVFAPRHPTEFARVLRPGGLAVIAVPTADHLAELIEPLGLLRVDPDKSRRLDTAVAGHLHLRDTRTLRWQVTVDHPLLRAVVGMGPSADHLDGATLNARIAELPDEVTVTGAVDLHLLARPDPR